MSKRGSHIRTKLIYECNVSVSSKYDHLPSKTPRYIFMGEFPTPGRKESLKLQPPDLSKQAKTPPLGHFPQLFTIKPEKIMQNCKILSSLRPVHMIHFKDTIFVSSEQRIV